ncbi:hypothetical protein Trydic_g22685 [Trypoxylus dichotomus]
MKKDMMWQWCREFMEGNGRDDERSGRPSERTAYLVKQVSGTTKLDKTLGGGILCRRFEEVCFTMLEMTTW